MGNGNPNPRPAITIPSQRLVAPCSGDRGAPSQRLVAPCSGDRGARPPPGKTYLCDTIALPSCDQFLYCGKKETKREQFVSRADSSWNNEVSHPCSEQGVNFSPANQLGQHDEVDPKQATRGLERCLLMVASLPSCAPTTNGSPFLLAGFCVLVLGCGTPVLT